MTVIADYGKNDDLAFAEVEQRLYEELGVDNVVIGKYGVPVFDTVATGFKLAQLAINSKLGDDHKFYVNTAPRKDDVTPRKNNSGEGLAYAKLKNGIEIVAVNSGYSLSFIRDQAETIRKINCAVDGSQFRSRDIFPISFRKIFEKNYEELGDQIDNIPDAPLGCLYYTDGYGNLKCMLNEEDIEEFEGQEVDIKINNMVHTAKFMSRNGMFSVPDGTLCLSYGSSGWLGQKFTEISLRGGSAARLYNYPRNGLQINIRSAIKPAL